MKKKYLGMVSIVILCLNISCIETNKKKGVIYFTRADCRDSVNVVLDTIPISHDIFNPIAFHVIKDSLLLVRNAQNSDFLVEVYNLNTKQLLTKAARRGKGFNEVLGGFTVYSSEQSYFLFFDMISRRFQKYDIDSLIAYKEHYLPILQNTPREAVDIALIDSNRFVFYDDRYLESKKFSNGLPELGIEYLNPATKYSAKDFKYFAGSINGGKIYNKPDHSKIAVFSLYDDKINIYDHQLVLQKTIKGPDNYLPEFITQQNQWGTVVVKGKNLMPAYGLGFATNDYIYTVYLGYKDFKKYTEIFKLDWDGKLIKRYIVQYHIDVLSISNGYIYGTASEEPRSMPKLVRFKI